MNIKLATAWVSTSQYNNSEGVLEIDNVGKQTILLPLPKEIIDQIEAFYIAEYHRRMERVMAAA